MVRITLSTIFVLIIFPLYSQKEKNFKIVSLNTSYSDARNTHPNLKEIRTEITKQSINLIDIEKGKVEKRLNKSNFLSDLNTFVISPDQNYLVAYKDGESGVNEILFYKSDGTILSRQAISIYPKVSYSINGEFVIIFNHFGREVFVFTKNGMLIFQWDYIEIINDNTKILHNVFVSEDCNRVAINAGSELFIVDTKQRKVQYNTSIGRVLQGAYYTSKNRILVKTIGGKENTFDIKLISINGGTVLENITNMKRIGLTENGFISEHENKTQEYEIR